jgi:nitrogen fixation NifU-like protein
LETRSWITLKTPEIAEKFNTQTVLDIKDARFKTAGCALSIASASMVTELVKGVTIKEALFLSPADVSQALGGIPEEKMHCSELAVDALYRALTDYCTRSSNSKNEKR